MWQRKTIKVRVQKVSKFSFGSPLDFAGSINQTTHTFLLAGISIGRRADQLATQEHNIGVEQGAAT